MKFDFPGKDVMRLDDVEGVDPKERWNPTFDGASNSIGHGIREILISPRNAHLPFTARLCFDCTNNVAEYEACVMGLEESIDLKIKILEVFRASLWSYTKYEVIGIPSTPILFHTWIIYYI